MTETVALPADLDARVHRFLTAACARNLRLATAESCTGGLLAVELSLDVLEEALDGWER